MKKKAGVCANEVVKFLDRELRIADFRDSSNNGLQVENSGRVDRICCGVDASLDFFEAAARRGAGLVVVHHGMSWRDSLKRIQAMNYRRVQFLMDNDIALYAAHLPMDAHPRHGNNAVIASRLALKERKLFAEYEGRLIGVRGQLPRAMARSQFLELVRSRVGRSAQMLAFGAEKIRSVAIVSGGGAVGLEDAGKTGIDAYISGEPNLGAYYIAREYGINAVFAGHYRTETYGPIAIAGLLKRRFGIQSEFIDTRVPY